MTCAGENWNRFWLSLSHTHETILISEPDECLIWQMSEPIWSSWLRIYERGTKSVQLGKIFDRQFLPLMMSSSGSRETMVKLLARPAKLGGNSTYLLIKLEPPIFNSTLPTCRWGVCRRRGRCPRHQSSKVLADRLTRRHSNTPVYHSDETKDENLESVKGVWIWNYVVCPDNDVEERIKFVELTSLYLASLVWMNLACAPGTSP